MANEGGHRPYWPTHLGVNLSNGNLTFSLGQGTCVTCGGGGTGPVYPNPADTALHGPVLTYNTLGTADTVFGSKWMCPYDTYFTLDGSDNVTLIDADGTSRFFEIDSFDTPPQTYSADKESAVLTSTSTEYTLTRRNGEQWVHSATHKNLLRIVARTGHTITVARDGSQRITSVTDGQGRVTTFLYQTFGGITRCVEIREPAPGAKGFSSTFFGYDSSGRLIVVTNAIGEATRFTYDGSNRIATAIDGHGHATVYTYDGSSRVTNIEDPNSNDTGIAYATSPSITATVTNRLTFETVYTFDASGRVTKVKDAEDNETEFTYDSSTWELLTMLGPKIPKSGTPWSRHRTVFIWDTGSNAHDLLKKELRKATNSDATGTLLSDEEWVYSDEHDVESYTDQLNHTTTYAYQTGDGADGLGLLASITNAETDVPLVNVWEEDAGIWRLASTTNGVSKTTEFLYDDHSNDSYGAPNKIIFPSDNYALLDFDVRGRKTSEKVVGGNATTFEYDALDRLIRTVNPDGSATESLYDCCHLAATLDENKVGPTYEYDVMGNMTAVTDANGERTTYEFDDEGRLTSRTDPRGKTTTWTYDDIGRVLQVDYPGGWQEIMTYFEPGMLKTLRTKKSSDEDTITFVYDDSYFLIKKDFSSGTDTDYEVDAKGRRTKMTDASGEKRYTWDDADRLEKVIHGPAGFTTNQHFQVEYVWNGASQCTQKKVTIRTLSALQWDHAYTDDGNLDTVTNPDSEVTKHDYLADGRLKKITLRNTSGNKPTREFFYQDTDSSHAFVAGKNSHLRKTLDKKHAGTVICSSEYDLDAAGMRLGRTDHDGKYDAWAYDPSYQLRAESRWSAKTPGTQSYRKEYDYDPNGNRLLEFADGVKTATTVGDNNQLTAVGDEDFMTDFFGNTVDISDGVTDQFFEYNWERNLLQSYYDEAAADSHEYDGNGRRMRSRLNAASNWTHFVHDELTEQVLCEFTLVSSTFTLKAANTYGWGLISSNRETVKRYFHFDGLGNTVALTDSSGDVQDTYVWTAFGVLLSSTGSSVNPYRYVGQWGYYDDGAMGSPHDFVLCGVRYYAPRYGRFLTWDPIGERGYGYCDNSATMAIDPTGLITRGDVCAERLTTCRQNCAIKGAACFAAVGLATTACLKLCPSTGPAAGWCVVGCTAAGIAAIAACYVIARDCNDNCQAEYEQCIKPVPIPTPTFQNRCWGACFWNCVRGGHDPQWCGSDCTQSCLKLERTRNAGAY